MSVSKNIFLLLLLSTLICVPGFAQKDRQSLESQKRKLLQKIQETERILSQTATQRKSSVGRLRALNKQIQTRTSLIKAINGEVKLLDDNIAEDQAITEAMQQDLEQLKKEYATMVYAAYKAGKGINELTFLFSSNTFNQLLMRMKYIKYYSQARKKQGEQILMVQEDLQKQIIEMQNQRNKKQALLNEELFENRKLENLRGEQRTLVNKLSQEESRIKKQLENQRKAERELTKRISEIIAAETRAAALASVDMTQLTKAFVEERGKLPWPVDEGFISSKFGIHRHPTLRRITVKNEGVDIQTPKDAKVKAVFPGKVNSIISIPGMGNTVILQHGEYFTVYSKLKTVIIKKGDQVQVNQELGQVLTDNENVSEVKFRIHDKKGSINPESWLKAK